MKDIDKWFAEQCGVDLEGFYGWFQMVDGEPAKEGQHWTIQDPRCREVIRDKFRIETIRVFDLQDWYAYIDPFDGQGKTIAEAEIACCKAIYEAQK